MVQARVSFPVQVRHPEAWGVVRVKGTTCPSSIPQGEDRVKDRLVGMVVVSNPSQQQPGLLQQQLGSAVRLPPEESRLPLYRSNPTISSRYRNRKP